MSTTANPATQAESLTKAQAVGTAVAVGAQAQKKQKWGDMEEDDCEKSTVNTVKSTEPVQQAQHSNNANTSAEQSDAPKYGDRNYRYPDLKHTVREIQIEFLNKKFRPAVTTNDSSASNADASASVTVTDQPNQNDRSLKYAYPLTDAERRVGNTLCSRILSGIQVAEDIGIAAFVRLRARPASEVEYTNAHGKQVKESNEVGTTGLTIDYELWNNDRHADLKRLSELFKQSKQSTSRSSRSNASGISISDQQYQDLKKDLENRLVVSDRPYRQDNLYVHKQLLMLVRAFEAAKSGLEASREQLLETTNMTTVERDDKGQVVKENGQVVKVPLVDRYTFYSMGIMDQTTYETLGSPKNSNKHQCYQLTIVPDLKRRYDSLNEYVKYLTQLFIEERNQTVNDRKRERAGRTLVHLLEMANKNINYVLKHMPARRRSLFHRETLLYASFNDMSDAYKIEHGQRVPNRSKSSRGRGGVHAVSKRAPRGGRIS